MTYQLTIHGEPLGKERPRKGKGGHFYTPTQTRDAQDRVKLLARHAWGLTKPDREPWRLVLHFHVKDREGRDGDNLEKLIMDALQGVLWVNDSQVLDTHWIIHPNSPKPFTTLTAERITTP